MNKNNLELDYQTIVVKKEKAKDIIKKYECFGWIKIESKQHPQYENLLEIKLSRPHKIKNKDALQFLQVNMEVNIINQGRLEKTKHSKSLIFALTLGFLTLVCAFNSVLAFFNMRPTNAVIVGSLFAVTAITCAVIIAVFTHKIIKKERKTYEEKSKQYSTEIEDIIKKAKEFLEGNDE